MKLLSVVVAEKQVVAEPNWPKVGVTVEIAIYQLNRSTCVCAPTLKLSALANSLKLLFDCLHLLSPFTRYNHSSMAVKR